MTLFIVCMVGCIITTALLFFVLLFILRASITDTEGVSLALMLSLVFSVCIWVFIMLGMAFSIGSSEKTTVLQRTIEISSLKDNQNVTTDMSYLISTEGYYYYMKDSEKGKKMEKVPTENAYIKESTSTPRVEIYDSHLTEDWAIFLNDGTLHRENAEYIFYVPKNTVSTEFNVDME